MSELSARILECCFCRMEVPIDVAQSAGPTTDYPVCCPVCFDNYVVDHLHPKWDILKETRAEYFSKSKHLF